VDGVAVRRRSSRIVTLVTDVTVDRDEAGVLFVSWTNPDGVAVDVAVGGSQVPAAHRVVAAGTTGSSLRLDDVGDGRIYVSLAAAGAGPIVVAAERRVPFAGITNLRDLGGYPTADGGRTRWGLVFRADALHKLTAEDLVEFGALSVRTVYDLRGDVERDEFPGPVPSRHVPISGRPPGVAAPAPPLEMTAAAGEQMLRDMYVGALEHSATNIAEVLRSLADPEAVPAVFHCHGGKDRTGVVAAVLLLALGVNRETVLDDYELTRRYRLPEHQQDSLENMLANGVSPEAAASVLGTPRWAMGAALDAIDEAYGGVERYLDEVAHLTAGELAALRAGLVDL
jgi:protein-tyrosine phosphatase